MGTVTNSIGTASRDYSTIALWEAALPASAVTAANSYVGQCYNDTEFNLSTTALTIGGTTTDATHTITLTTGTGQGFRDAAGAASNALRYNQSNGAAATANVGYNPAFIVSDDFVTIQNLQLKNTSVAGNAVCLIVTGSNFTLDSCIIQHKGGATQAYALKIAQTPFSVTNCVIIADSSSAYPAVNWGQVGSMINCAIVKPSNQTANGSGVSHQYTFTGSVIQNCVIAGFGAAFSGAGTGITGSGNATDTGSYPSGITGQTGLTIATEFVQPSNGSSVMDWRLNSTSVACKDNGTNSGAPTTDIIGQAISNTTRDAGAWELQQGGGAVSVNVTGVSSTSAVGTNTVTGFGNVPVTGVASTSAAGTPTVTGFANVSLTGVVSASQVGTPTVTVGGAVNVNLTGVSAATATGALTLTGFANVSLTGVAASAAVGSLTTSAAANASLTGVAAISAAGAQTVTGLANVSPTGVESAGITGNVTASVPTAVSVTLLGVQSNIVVGTLSTNLDQPDTAGQTILTDRRGPSVALSRKRYEQLIEEIERENRELVKLEKKAQAAKAPKKVLKQVEQKAAKIERLETKLTDLEIEEDDMEVLRMIFRLAA